MQKQRIFQAGMLLSKNGGLAPRVEKCEFPREKRDRYGFTPLKRIGFLLNRSQSVRIIAEMTRKSPQTSRKPTIAANRWVSSGFSVGDTGFEPVTSSV
jgi:hypothetical protein